MSISYPLLLLFWVEFVSGAAPSSEFENQLTHLTIEVIDKYFAVFRCVTYVLDEGVEMSFTQQLPAFVIRLPSEKDLLTQSFEQGCGGYIVRVEDKSAVARSLISAKHSATAFRYNNQRYLFLPMHDKEDATKFLQEPEMFFLPNLNLVVPENGSLLVTTHTVFDHYKQDLQGILHEVLDLWSPTGFAVGKDLYPDKLLSLNGKKFVFAVVNYSPFSLVETQGNRTVFDGFETRIAAEFVAVVNGTWEGLDHPIDLWGTTFPNGSGTGIIGSVLDHKADFGFSAMYQWYCEECDCTYPFYQSAVTCLVPRPQPLFGWLTIVLPFTPSTWMALIVTYFITSTSFMALQLMLQHINGVKISQKIGMAVIDSLFTNFRLQLEQIPDVRKMKSPLSVYVKVSVYYYFFVAASWQGGISSILTLPSFEAPIDTTEDLIERWPKLQWGANSDAWTNSLKASTDPNLIQIVSKFTTYDDSILRQKTKTRDYAFFIEKLPHGHYGFSDFINEENMEYLRLMESNIYTAFGVLIQPRGSPYAEKFDEVILRLFDTGIVHKIEDQVSLDRINNRLQNMIRFSNLRDARAVKLKVKHIQGPLMIFAAGMSASVMIFLLEIFHFRQNKCIGRMSASMFNSQILHAEPRLQQEIVQNKNPFCRSLPFILNYK